MIRKPFIGRVPSISYPGSKSGLAKTIVGFMPQFGRIYKEACAGKGNVFWAAAKFLKFEEWWINDLQTAPFFEALRDIGDSIIVPECTPEEFERCEAAFTQGSRESILLEPYFTYSGCGFEHSGQKGNRDHPTKPAGYQRMLRSCHEILRRTNARITGINFKHMGLEDLGPEDFVYFDLPYLSGKVKTIFPRYRRFPIFVSTVGEREIPLVALRVSGNDLLRALWRSVFRQGRKAALRETREV